MKNLAAVAHGLTAPFAHEEINLPDLQPTHVLVRNL